MDRNEFCKADREEHEEDYYDGSRTPEIQPSHSPREAKAEAARDRAVGVHEEQGEDFNDPGYWRRKETIYRAACDVLPRESALERARRHAYIERKRLDTFLASRALLRNENHEEFATNPKYWLKREEYYYTKHRKLERKFWDRLRLVRFNTKEVTLREAMSDAH